MDLHGIQYKSTVPMTTVKGFDYFLPISKALADVLWMHGRNRWTEDRRNAILNYFF